MTEGEAMKAMARYGTDGHSGSKPMISKTAKRDVWVRRGERPQSLKRFLPPGKQRTKISGRVRSRSNTRDTNSLSTVAGMREKNSF
jgi:hypothetical protein